MSFEKTFEHKQKLLDAALKEFIAYGYEQASINRILDDAGMSKGQFYYHFKNKASLYLALTDLLVEQKQQFLASVMRPEDFQQDIFTVFKTQIEHGVAFAAQYPAVNDFGQSFVREKGNAIYEKAMARHDFGENDGINQLIEQAYQRGEFREDLPLAFIKRTIGYLFNNVADFADLTNPDEIENNLNYLIDFMRSGLAGRKETSNSAPASAR
ncbi:TetR/AcrR family transcriptional regulator [Candidatus Leptofilum sp.]|uniref:TetR/AcrR family transcriptional regulator n=1 Tax=Candidatus Leptofilum sp. TaxID=3241576 RepID=UPI003B5BBF9B